MALLVGSAAAAEAPDEFPGALQLPSQPGLPDPLVKRDGSRVTTWDQWRGERVPELRALFQHYMYGQIPPAPTALVVKVEREDPGYFGGKATLREVAIVVQPVPNSPTIHLLLVIPNRRTSPAPVFVGTNFHGNHALLADPAVRLPTAWMPPSAPGAPDHRATDAGRGREVGVWSIEKVIDHGYAVATFYCGDVAPDHPGKNDGIFATLEGQSSRADGLSAIGAWAWGISRAVDFLVGVPELDASKIAVVGHSRLGKAAMLAGGFDERIALVVAHQAGCGGTAPSRGKVGESVKQINDRFPHWFDDVFKTFNDCPDRLPFDQNGLIALAAPRPVLLTNATEDNWANPAGQFEALLGANGVYRLAGTVGITDREPPPPGKLVGDRLAFHIRPGKHAMGPDDWDVFLAFADRHLGSRKITP
jgi:hypothetical protein